LAKAARTLAIASYDDIFTPDATKAGNSLESVLEIPLGELFPFENHPFQVRDDEAMQETAESVREYGVLVPAIARPRAEGGYELIAGHRRKRACELAGKETMPVLVRDMDDDAATIIMVDSTLQRETLLPSERAFAYRMKLDAIKHQGARTDLTSSQDGNKSKLSVEIVAEQAGESKNQIFRYIRLTELVPDLLDMVDADKIAFNPAVELSFLTRPEQTELLDVMNMYEATPSLSQAQSMKKLSQSGELTREKMEAFLSEPKKEPDKVTLQGSKIKQFFPPGYTPQQMESIILKLLAGWHKKYQQAEAQ